MISSERKNSLDATLESILSFPGRELSGLSVFAIRDGKPVYEGYFGTRRFRSTERADDGRQGDPPVDSETRWRIASISKPATAIGAMILVERGLLDPDGDISDYLGFTLRNPHFPGIPITARMLLSHTSGLRDADYYFPPLSHEMRELFEPEGRHYDGGAHFAGPEPARETGRDTGREPGRDTSPGRFYCYCNLGYGVIATAMERITHRRFDLFMRDELFEPLGIDGGFNVNLVSDAHFEDISPIYRKSPGDDGPWDPCGPWIPQTDDFRGVRPSVAVRIPEDGPAPRLEEYEPGTNGALFSPQGGLRIRARDLGKIAALFIGGGEVDLSRFGGQSSVRILREASVHAMCDPKWVRAADGSNCGDPSGLSLATGWGLMKNRGPRECDAESCRWWGHHGDAYGFLGGMLFDPDSGDGYLYMIGGVGADPERNRSRESGLFVWEDAIRRAIESALY